MKEYRFLSYEKFLEICNKMRYYDSAIKSDEIHLMNLLYTYDMGQIARRDITLPVLEELAELVVKRTIREVEKTTVMGMLADGFYHVYIN